MQPKGVFGGFTQNARLYFSAVFGSAARLRPFAPFLVQSNARINFAGSALNGEGGEGADAKGCFEDGGNYNRALVLEIVSWWWCKICRTRLTLSYNGVGLSGRGPYFRIA